MRQPLPRFAGMPWSCALWPCGGRPLSSTAAAQRTLTVYAQGVDCVHELLVHLHGPHDARLLGGVDLLIAHRARLAALQGVRIHGVPSESCPAASAVLAHHLLQATPRPRTNPQLTMASDRGAGACSLGRFRVQASTTTGGGSSLPFWLCSSLSPSLVYVAAWSSAFGSCSAPWGETCVFHPQGTLSRPGAITCSRFRLTTCCHKFRSSSMRTGLMRKSTAPCVTPRSTVLVSPFELITAHRASIPISQFLNIPVA